MKFFKNKYLVCFPFDGGVKQLSDSIYKKLDGYEYIEFSKNDPKWRKLKLIKLLLCEEVIFSSNNLFIYPFLPFIIGKVKIIHHDHKARFGSSLKERLILKLFNIFRNQFNLVVIHSELDDYAKDLLKQNNVLYKELPPHGFPNEGFEIDSTKHVINALKKKTILCFGRIEKYKNFEWFSNLVGKEKDINLIIAGKGELNDSEIYKYSNVTVINEYISEKKLAYLMSTSHYLALPYRDITQTGLFELAAYFGKPVILSDVFNVERLSKYVPLDIIPIDDNNTSLNIIKNLDISGDKYWDKCILMKQYFTKCDKVQWDDYIETLNG